MTPAPHHLAVFVTDVEASVAFHRRAFGFREVYRFGTVHFSQAHCGQFGRRLALRTTRRLRLGGWSALALLATVEDQDWALGLVSYSGHTSLAAGLIFGALIANERRKALRSCSRTGSIMQAELPQAGRCLRRISGTDRGAPR